MKAGPTMKSIAFKIKARAPKKPQGQRKQNRAAKNFAVLSYLKLYNLSKNAANLYSVLMCPNFLIIKFKA